MEPHQRGFSEKISSQTSPVYLLSPQTSPFPVSGGHLCIISAFGAGHSSPCQGNLFGPLGFTRSLGALCGEIAVVSKLLSFEFLHVLTCGAEKSTLFKTKF